MTNCKNNSKKDRRLYVLIDNTLAPVYGAVQGGHAVAQYMIDYDSLDLWKNEYLIYLRCNIRYWSKKLAKMNIPYSKFYEPDLHGKLTAISVCCDREVFKKLKILSTR